MAYTEQELEALLDKSGVNYTDLLDYAEAKGIKYAELMQLPDADVQNLVVEYYKTVVQAGNKVQRAINKSLGFNLKPQEVGFDTARAEGLAGRVKAPNFVKEVCNFGMTAVDETEKRHADLLSNVGASVKVVRTYDGLGIRRGTKYAESCVWCKQRAGTYDYETVKKSGSANKTFVFGRHTGCGCTIDLITARGKRVSSV